MYDQDHAASFERPVLYGPQLNLSPYRRTRVDEQETHSSCLFSLLPENGDKQIVDFP